MKTNISSPKSWTAAGLVFAVLLGVYGKPASAQAAHPVVGTWDCILSGPRGGTAYLTFFEDEESMNHGTFIGYEVMVPKHPKPTDIGDARGGEGEDRGGGTTPRVRGQQIFGAETPNGSWALDNAGRTIGHFIEVSALENCVTNAFPTSTNGAPPSPDPTPFTNSISGDEFCVTAPIDLTTNSLGNYNMQTICYTNIIICEALTNAISFVGKVVPGKRLTLISTTPFGKTAYRGVPAQGLPDISGDWFGTKKQAGTTYQEFLTLSPSGFPFPNIYDVVGAGPGYSYQGHAVLSSRKSISFVLGMDPPLPTDPVTVVRAVTGPFNVKNIAAVTRGFDQPGGVFTNRITFKATRFAP